MTKGQVCPAPVFSPRALVLAGILHMSLSPTTQAVTNPNYSRDKAVLISTAFFCSFYKTYIICYSELRIIYGRASVYHYLTIDDGKFDQVWKPQ